MRKALTKLIKSIRPRTMNDNTQGLDKLSLDGHSFTAQVMQRRKALETAYKDNKLALRLYEQIIREAYNRPDREQFILDELSFEAKVVEAGGFWTLSAIQVSDIAQDPSKWEARAVRKRD